MVQTLASVGDGCPDILVGYRGANYLIEIKDPEQPPSKRRLTTAQEHWNHGDHVRRPPWAGQAAIAHTVADALRIIGATAGDSEP